MSARVVVLIIATVVVGGALVTVVAADLRTEGLSRGRRVGEALLPTIGVIVLLAISWRYVG